MTVHGLWKDIVGRNGKKNTHKLSDLAKFVGKQDGEKVVVAVDISLLLYKAVRTIDAARELDVDPPIPVVSANKYMRRCHGLLTAHGIKPIYVFDGARNGLKAATNAGRTEDRRKVNSRLRKLVQEARRQDTAEVDKLRQEAAYPRDDVLEVVKSYYDDENIIYMCAPFEAEWQCVALERAGLVDAVLSDDGDCLVLGARTLVTLVNWSNDLGKCNLYRVEDVFGTKRGGAGKWNQHLPELSAFLGNDYINRLYSTASAKNKMKYKSALNLLSSYMASRNKNEWFETVEMAYFMSNPANPKGARISAAGFGELFQQVVFLIRHAPVFQLVPSIDGEAIDIADESTYSVRLAPLNPLPEGVSVQNWGARMGWEHSPAESLGADGHRIHPDHYEDALLFKIWPRTGVPLPSIPYPLLKQIPHYECMHGSYVNTEHTPPVHWPKFLMRRYLFVRDKLKKGKVSFETMLRCVNESLRQEREAPGRAKQPKQRSQVCAGKSYQIMENLVVSDGPIEWRKNQEEIFATIRSLREITQEAVDEWFGIHTGITYRALCRFEGGHYDPTTIEMAYVTLKDDATPAILFRIKCTPSVKSPPYWTYLAFEATKDGSPRVFIPAPVSRCECPAGFLFCSHMLGFLCILHLVQKYPLWTSDTLSAAMPPPVKSIHSFPFPWSHAFGPNAVDMAVRRQGRQANAEDGDHDYFPQDEELDNDEAADAVSLGSFDSVGSAELGFLNGIDDEEEDEGEAGEDGIEVDDGNYQQEQEQAEEPELLDDSGSDGIGNALQSPARNEEEQLTHETVPLVDEDDEESSRDSDYSVMNDDEERVDLGEEGDVLVENQASEDYGSGTRIDLIERVDSYIDSARMRATIESADEPFAHKLDVGKIMKAQEDILNDVGGPNESLPCKLEQLKTHERIHQLYATGRLKRKTLMSHYLYKTATARQRWIAQIEAVLAHNGLDPDEIRVIYIPVRLGKIPPGYYILADRGFSSCAPSYPFLNGQITPFFLDGRDQFEGEEVAADRTKCKLRYGSETKFSQVTDCTALKDRIPRSYFRHLHEICDFAHGASNFCEPFYLPYDEEDDYFADVRASREQKRRDISDRLDARKRTRAEREEEEDGDTNDALEEDEPDE